MRTDNPILVMDPRSAELTKYASQRDARDAHFVHQRHGESVRRGRRGHQRTSAAALGTDKRIGSSFLFPAWATAVHAFPRMCRR